MKKIIIFSALFIFSLYAETKQWEYCNLKIVKIDKNTSVEKIMFDKEYSEEQKKINQKINKTKMSDIHIFNILGKRGWELVMRYNVREAFLTTYYIFKRPRK